ncbi:roadblock/LC7 domain-containing protein [Actinomadura macrotermitis]|uniref:Serine protease inhibitor n=1 Tax=Actinomadura macrotermitis TaxID=2585200 RepID=A0A7K0BPQ7_9ACTN|nr:roadblock/LC7 domain-containing protein [Actinomadura macrotermitis]MQY03168.1 Serine protease inhibitor [Actinomadura macrotermitis]
MTETRTAGEVERLLDGMAERVDSVDGAIVLSREGIVVASTAALAQEAAERLSALVSGVQGLARGACHRFGGGEVLQSVIELDTVLLFMVPAGEETIAVLSRADGDAGTIAYELAQLAERLAG